MQIHIEKEKRRTEGNLVNAVSLTSGWMWGDQPEAIAVTQARDDARLA